MSEIDQLLHHYTHVVRLPWQDGLSGAERIWFVVYTPGQERRLRLRLPDFQAATQNAGYRWGHIDLTDSFAEWMAAHDYRDAYFQSPELLDMELASYAAGLCEEIRQRLTAPAVDRHTVFALTGLSTLFGLTSVSALVNSVQHAVPGRLLVFFPGYKDGSNYRFLDAKDGWNYLAIAITPADGASL